MTAVRLGAGLEMLKSCAANAQTSRFVVRPTCNQKSVRIEDLVGHCVPKHEEGVFKQWRVCFTNRTWYELVCFKVCVYL